MTTGGSHPNKQPKPNERKQSAVQDEQDDTPLSAPDRQIVVLPIRVNDGVGVYPEAYIRLVKLMRRSGLTIDYLHDEMHRTFYGTRSGIVQDVVAFAIAFGSTVSATLFVQWLQGDGRSLKLRLKAKVEKRPDGSSSRWFEAEGKAESVAALLERFLESDE